MPVVSTDLRFAASHGSIVCNNLHNVHGTSMKTEPVTWYLTYFGVDDPLSLPCPTLRPTYAPIIPILAPMISFPCLARSYDGLTHQDNGGMATVDGSRKRSSGGVFFTLLKEHMSPAKLKELYADEIRVKKERDRAKRYAIKRNAEAAEAGEDTMPPRNRPRHSGGGRTWRDSGRFVGPSGDGDAVKRARTNQSAGDW